MGIGFFGVDLPRQHSDDHGPVQVRIRPEIDVILKRIFPAYPGRTNGSVRVHLALIAFAKSLGITVPSDVVESVTAHGRNHRPRRHR
jgi:hypothetical protein